MITRYVNTASTAGGDGTTNDPVGPPRAFATLAEAETQLRSLNAEEDVEILCCGAAADTTPVSFTSTYTYIQNDYTLFIKANRDDEYGYHGGKWNTSTYRLSIPNTTSVALDLYQITWPMVIDGIQIDSDATTAALYAYKSGSGYKTFLIQNCLIFCGANCPFGIQATTPATVTIYNTCVCGTTGKGIQIGQSGIGHHLVYNNIVCGFTCGVYGGTAESITIKNSCVFNNDNDFDTLYATINVDHTASDDGDGTNPVTVSNWADEFYNSNYIADVDFRLKATSVLLNAGIGHDLDGNVPTTDIVDDERSGSAATLGIFENAYAPPAPSSPVSVGFNFIGQLHGQLHGQ